MVLPRDDVGLRGVVTIGSMVLDSTRGNAVVDRLSSEELLSGLCEGRGSTGGGFRHPRWGVVKGMRSIECDFVSLGEPCWAKRENGEDGKGSVSSSLGEVANG